MNIFVLASEIPIASHTTRAATHVLHNCITALAKEHRVILQPILRRGLITAAEQEALQSSVSSQCTILPPLLSDDYMPTRFDVIGRARRIIGKRCRTMNYFYPTLALRSMIDRRAEEYGADIFFIFWNAEGVAATYGNHRLPKIAYYGMPDHAAALAKLNNADLFGRQRTSAEHAQEAKMLSVQERHHLALMRDCDSIANLSADHARYYAEHGHSDSMYVPNMWSLPDQPFVIDQHALQNRKPKICGNLGRLQATGNTFGLLYIGKELLPRLDACFGVDGYEMHLFGQGEPVEAVRGFLDHPAVRMRGWVQDIDAEICSSHIFLVANNAYDAYRGSHTRFLHGWSLKSCAVGHAYNTFANPEMIHDRNILLADTPDALVMQIARAIRDPDLRMRIGQAGYNTFIANFTPEVVVASLLLKMQSLVSHHSS